MAEYPEEIPLSKNVSTSRVSRQKGLVRSLQIAISIRLFIAAVEFITTMFYFSSSILLDAIGTSLDVVSSLALILCVKIAARPPDENHPFGHGRVEPLAGFLIGIFLFITGLGLGIQQIYPITTSLHDHAVAKELWMIPLAAFLLLQVCFYVMMRKARETNSPALAADAWHYQMDAWTSFVAMIALLAGTWFPDWGGQLDHFGAFVIAFVLLIVGLLAAKENLDQLMDRIPENEFFKRVRNAALSVKGVKETEKLMIQLTGPDAHVSIDIEVDPKMSVDDAHRISQKVRASIQSDWPQVREAIVHIEPYYPNDH